MSEQSAVGMEQFSSSMMSDNLLAEATVLGPSLTDTTPDRARSSTGKDKSKRTDEKCNIICKELLAISSVQQLEIGLMKNQIICKRE